MGVKQFLDLTDKVGLITGGSRGLGLQMAAVPGEDIFAGTPHGRIVGPEDIEGLVVLLASEAGRQVERIGRL